MSTSTVTPDAGGAVAGGGSAPAAGTSASPSTSAPAGGTGASADPQPGQSSTDFIRQELQKVDISGVTDAPKPEPVAQEEPPAAAVEDPAEHPATEKTEDEIKAEAEKATAAEVPDEPNPLDKLGPLPAETVAEALKSPTFVEACKAVGLDTNALMETSRAAARESQYYQEVGSLETAKYVKQGAERFFNMEDKFTKIDSSESFDDFMMNVWLPTTVIHGEDGQPIKNADGTFKTDGSIANFFKYTGALERDMGQQLISADADAILADPNASEDDKAEANDFKIMLGMMQRAVANGYKIRKPAELPPEVRRAQDELKQREKALNDRETQQKVEAKNIFAEKAWADATRNVNSWIGAVVKQSGLAEELQVRASDEILKGLSIRLEGDGIYNAMKQDIFNRGVSDKGAKELVALHKASLERFFKDSANAVMKVYGAKAVDDNTLRNSKINTQLSTDRMNQAGATTAGKPPTTGSPSPDAVFAQAQKEILDANGGRRPNDFNHQVLAKVMAAAAKQANIA